MSKNPYSEYSDEDLLVHIHWDSEANEEYNRRHPDSEPYWFLAYNCPVDDTGHFSLEKGDVNKGLQVISGTVLIKFLCVSCGGEHQFPIGELK